MGDTTAFQHLETSASTANSHCWRHKPILEAGPTLERIVTHLGNISFTHFHVVPILSSYLRKASNFDTLLVISLEFPWPRTDRFFFCGFGLFGRK